MEKNDMEIKVERTGNCYSIASSEYLVTFPDGSIETIWSPPWHEWEEDEEDAKALEYACKLWYAKQETFAN
jgi:hypothetical protein